MNSTDDALRQRVIDLRLGGRSRAQIQSELGLGHSKLDRWLRGVPPAEWTRRPRAKDDVRDQARALRLTGRSVPAIAAELGVSKSSVSLWVRDLPSPYDGLDRRQKLAVMSRQGGESTHRRSLAERDATRLAAAAQVGRLNERELLLVGAALYWAEGGKNKPWNRNERVVFVNSDPGMIQVFLRWLALLGVDPRDVAYRLQIHESADEAAARRFWADLVGIAPEQFDKTSLKRHNPKTNRRNTGEGYRGCLVVSVRRSSELYRRIEGWWSGIAEARRGAIGVTVEERSPVV